MRRLILASAVLAAAIAGDASGVNLAVPNPAQSPWTQCCGAAPWPAAPASAATQGLARSLPRHTFILMSGIPAQYKALSNPLPRSRGSIERGAIVYENNCASCHGVTGAGDGPAGRALMPPPGDLAWLSQMPMVEWDPFMYWSVAEGGAQFKSAMPAFKGGLARADIWAVIGYIQARLPPTVR